MLIRRAAKVAAVRLNIRKACTRRRLMWLLSRGWRKVLLSLLCILSMLGRASWGRRRERVVRRTMRAPTERRVASVLLVRARLLLMTSIRAILTGLLLMRAVLLAWLRVLLTTILLV